MAETLEQTLDTQQQIATGLASLIPGAPGASRINGLSAGGLAGFLKYSKENIDNNAGAGYEQPGVLRFVTGNDAKKPGARDNALSLIDRYNKDPSSLSAQDIQAAQALVGSAFGPLDNDWSTISPIEGNYLVTLESELRAGTTLGELFNQNYQSEQERLQAEAAAQAAREAAEREAAMAAEAAAQAVATRKAEVAGTLYNAGYLTAENAENDMAIAAAMNDFIAKNTPQRDWAKQQELVFGGDFEKWTLSPYASTFIASKTQGMYSARLESDLESGQNIELAQGFLRTQGHDGVTVNGVVDRETFNAGTQEIQKPLTIPEGILVGENSIDHGKLMNMAAKGQLLLPGMDEKSLAEYLSPEDVEVAMMYDPAGTGSGTSREAFVAERMLGDNPDKYRAFLAAENAKRAGATLDAPVLDLAEISKENVAPIVENAEQTLTQVADLPPSLASVIVAHAADRGGSVQISELPMLIEKANGGNMGPDQSLNHAEGMAVLVGMDQDALRTTVSLDPSSPDFTANMQEVLKYAYVLDNATSVDENGNRVTMDTIPSSVVSGFEEVAANQAQVSNTGTDNMLESLGLPTSIITELRGVTASDGKTIAINSIIEAAVKTGSPELMMKLQGADPIFALYAANVYEDGPQQKETQDIINTGSLDLTDPKQLSLALQIVTSLKDGKTLDEIGSDVSAKIDAVAKGYLGAEVGKEVPTVSPEAAPDAKPDGGTPRIRNNFDDRAAGVPTATNTTPAEPATNAPARQQLAMAGGMTLDN